MLDTQGGARTGDGRSVPAHLKSAILREIDRLELVLRQIGQVETERDEMLQLTQPSSPAALLMRLKGIGAEFASVLYLDLRVYSAGLTQLPRF
jgi:transposase